MGLGDPIHKSMLRINGEDAGMVADIDVRVFGKKAWAELSK